MYLLRRAVANRTGLAGGRKSASKGKVLSIIRRKQFCIILCRHNALGVIRRSSLTLSAQIAYILLARLAGKIVVGIAVKQGRVLKDALRLSPQNPKTYQRLFTGLTGNLFCRESSVLRLQNTRPNQVCCHTFLGDIAVHGPNLGMGAVRFTPFPQLLCIVFMLLLRLFGIGQKSD